MSTTTTLSGSKRNRAEFERPKHAVLASTNTTESCAQCKATLAEVQRLQVKLDQTVAQLQKTLQDFDYRYNDRGQLLNYIS